MVISFKKNATSLAVEVALRAVLAPKTEVQTFAQSLVLDGTTFSQFRKEGVEGHALLVNLQGFSANGAVRSTLNCGFAWGPSLCLLSIFLGTHCMWHH